MSLVESNPRIQPTTGRKAVDLLTVTHKRRSFQSMLGDIPIKKPDLILVQRRDRFGTADPNQLGYFLTILKEHRVRLITAIDGVDLSKDDLATILQNVLAAAQSKQEQIDKAERVLTGKRGKAVLGQYLGGKYLVYGFDLVCIGRDGEEKWRMVEDGWDLRVKYILDHNGDYVEVERYGNEVVKDPNGIMPDKPNRFRPTKEKGEKLFYSPSIRRNGLIHIAVSAKCLRRDGPPTVSPSS